MKTAANSRITAAKVDRRKSPPPEQLERLKQHAFPPGVSGNPSGRPREIMGPAYRRALLRKIPNDAAGRIVADAVAEKMVALALKGDIRIAIELADRLDGRPQQSMSFDGAGIPLEILNMTTEQKRQRLAELLAKARGTE